MRQHGEGECLPPPSSAPPPPTSPRRALHPPLRPAAADERAQDLFLYTLLLLNPGRRTLVFANSVSTVRHLTPLLQNLQLPLVLPLHSHMAQKARLRSVERFAAQASSVLVATDVAARGLD